MGNFFTPLDLGIFFATLAAVMGIGLYAGRKEETSSDYYLAGRNVRWWGVAGSIFGSNVSANHMVGMMGVGFSFGFAQSHYELGAIAGLMLLCYGFLPVYRKLNLYTLSEYLEKRYDERSRISYALIMLIIMVGVHMSQGLYIGARSICLVLGGDAVVKVNEGLNTNLQVSSEYYVGFVIALAVIAAIYTIQGGLKAVIMTDVLQSVILLVAGLLVAWLTFDRLGGWGEMMRLDAEAGDASKMHLYLPVNHSKLPWTGVLTGLMAMHCFYWGTNQFIVQRALGARSDSEARLGIVTAGFLKLTIPFFSICGGIAAYYLFSQNLDMTVEPDEVFTELVKMIIPAGYGLVGIISAGVIGAILSSVDSMMNSAATIVAVDIYKRHLNPEADDRQLIWVGRISIVVFVALAAFIALFLLDPNSSDNFFLQVADYQNYFTPGLLVAFALGMFWRRGTPAAGFAAIIAGVVFSWGVESGYNQYVGTSPESPVIRYLGSELCFLHRVVFVLGLSAIVYVIVSLMTPRDPEKERYVWTDLGGHSPEDLRHVFWGIGLSVAVFAVLGGLLYSDTLSPLLSGSLAYLWTLVLFVRAASKSIARRVAAGGSDAKRSAIMLWISEDRLWAGLLSGLAVFLMFYFK